VRFATFDVVEKAAMEEETGNEMPPTEDSTREDEEEEGEEETRDAEIVELEEGWGVEEEHADAAVNIQLDAVTVDSAAGPAEEMPTSASVEEDLAGEDPDHDDDDQPAKVSSVDHVDVLDRPPEPASDSSEEDEVARQDVPSRPDALDRVFRFGPDEVAAAEDVVEEVDERAQYADVDAADTIDEDEPETSVEEFEAILVCGPTVCRPGDIPGHAADYLRDVFYDLCTLSANIMTIFKLGCSDRD